MIEFSSMGWRVARLGAIGAALAIGASVGGAQNTETVDRPPPAFTVDGEIALNSLISLTEVHLRKLQDMLTVLAKTDDARSCDWDRIRKPLAEAASTNVPAVYWFAEPSGAYWTLGEGRAPANLASRAYFPRVLSGKTVLGELVVSRSTNRNTAIVAVPVQDSDKTVIGVLGASVHLDSLAGLLRAEMGGLRDGMLFFAIDGMGLGALNSDPSLIFTEPLKLGDEAMQTAFQTILASQAGIVKYDFHGSNRTVLFSRSAVTGWAFGFGVIDR